MLPQFRVKIINRIRLFLDSFPQCQIGLQHFLHHIDSMHDSLSYTVFLLIRNSGNWLISVLLTGLKLHIRDLFELLAFLSEELVYVFFLVDYSFGDQLSLVDGPAFFGDCGGSGAHSVGRSAVWRLLVLTRVRGAHHHAVVVCDFITFVHSLRWVVSIWWIATASTL